MDGWELRERDAMPSTPTGALVSVSENVEETASGRLVEGLHALEAEFDSFSTPNAPRSSPPPSSTYATGEWTLQRPAGELAHQGLTNRGRRDQEPKAITWQGLAKVLANHVYVGIVAWNGVRHRTPARGDSRRDHRTRPSSNTEHE